MFHFSGFLKSLGIVLFSYIAVSFIIGLFNIESMAILLTIMYGASYILLGILTPIWNKEAPYFASFLSSVTMTVLNLLFAMYFLGVMVFADPLEVNSSLVMNTSLSLLAAFLTVTIYKRRQGIKND